jgi:hypothetical protein
MLDFQLTSLSETNRILRQIAEALDRLAPPPLEHVAKKEPREAHDIIVTDDETLAKIELEEERKRMVLEGED